MDRWFASLIAGLLVLVGTSAAMVLQGESGPLQPEPIPPVPFQETYLNYLEKYGYFDHLGPLPRADAVRSAEQVREAVEAMQRFTGLPVTGEIDEDTVEMMLRPRCGVKDVNPAARFEVAGDKYKWNKDYLNYRITVYTDDLTRDEIDSDLNTAINLWRQASGISFTNVGGTTDEADITVLFGYAVHTSNAQDPRFYSTGVTVGHGFYPNSGWGDMDGDVHLNDFFLFTRQSPIGEGEDLLFTLTHELGHALGLLHSGNPAAVMWPTSRSYDPDFKLSQDDINGIQQIYGAYQMPPPPLAQ